MKYLVLGLTFVSLALGQSTKVSECFKVHSMIRADESHYWATWTNACPYAIDSVYVMVRFADNSSREVADGVWGLHFVEPGAHRTIRFSAPATLSDFTSVHQRKITADMEEAFGKVPAKPLSAVEMAAVSAYKHALQKEEAPRATLVSAIVGDAGEQTYREAALVAPRAAAMAGELGASFRTDFPDAWRAVLSAQESAVSPAPHGSFVRFVSAEKQLFQ